MNLLEKNLDQFHPISPQTPKIGWSSQLGYTSEDWSLNELNVGSIGSYLNHPGCGKPHENNTHSSKHFGGLS